MIVVYFLSFYLRTKMILLKNFFVKKTESVVDTSIIKFPRSRMDNKFCLFPLNQFHHFFEWKWFYLGKNSTLNHSAVDIDAFPNIKNCMELDPPAFRFENKLKIYFKQIIVSFLFVGNFLYCPDSLNLLLIQLNGVPHE